MINITENETCKGCKWNNYPECHGTIHGDGNFKRIDNLRPIFNCGVKNRLEVDDHRTWLFKPSLEDEISDLKERIIELEKSKI